jgi:hypothetical protein
MPKDNKEAYKEMYDMGKRLMEMAEAGGYSPGESEEDEEGMEYEESSPSFSKGDKVGAALSFMK